MVCRYICRASRPLLSAHLWLFLLFLKKKKLQLGRTFVLRLARLKVQNFVAHSLWGWLGGVNRLLFNAFMSPFPLCSWTRFWLCFRPAQTDRITRHVGFACVSVYSEPWVLGSSDDGEYKVDGDSVQFLFSAREDSVLRLGVFTSCAVLCGAVKACGMLLWYLGWCVGIYRSLRTCFGVFFTVYSLSVPFFQIKEAWPEKNVVWRSENPNPKWMCSVLGTSKNTTYAMYVLFLSAAFDASMR